jgi:hypothetical protein
LNAEFDVEFHPDYLPRFLSNFGLSVRGIAYERPDRPDNADESTVRPLLATCQQESLSVHTDCFRAYGPLDEEDAFTREYVVHGRVSTLMETFT